MSLAAALVLAPATAAADPALERTLARQMRPAGAHSGAYVLNLSTGRAAFRWRADRPRILASNTKLFTTTTALGRFGADGTLITRVLGAGRLDADGVWRGDLYLRGGGDPAFGSRSYATRYYRSAGGTVEELAALIEDAGVERVRGRIRGDESAFDALRGGPDSGFGVSPWVGPLSALSFNRGFADERGRSWQLDPPSFAAGRLDAALEARGVPVRLRPGIGATPAGADLLASVASPPMERLVRLTNKPSDNFFAEMLLKAVALDATGRGTTYAGARLAAAQARRLGTRARLVDGSGLSRADRASPRQIVRLLAAMYERDEREYDDAFFDSLAVAGQDGTLANRMRSGPAHWRCHGKTGTLSNVSALSGYCYARGGDTYAFSILMNFVYPPGARRLQDRMVQAIAAQ